MPKVREAGIASRLLNDYERGNDDLPRPLRRQMAVFALAHRVYKSTLNELFERNLGQTPWRHRAWFWWTCFRTAGIPEWWDPFASRMNDGAYVGEALRPVREGVTRAEWALLSRRYGFTIFNDNGEVIRISKFGVGWKDGPPQSVWTKGGNWGRRSSFTRIIILGEHIERDYSYNTMTRKLGPEGARALERELAGLIDPDALLVPDAWQRAVEYVRRRIPQMVGWKVTASYRTAAWFFDEPVREAHSGLYYDPRMDADYPVHINKHNAHTYWDWIPDEGQD